MSSHLLTLKNKFIWRLKGKIQSSFAGEKYCENLLINILENRKESFSSTDYENIKSLIPIDSVKRITNE